MPALVCGTVCVYLVSLSHMVTLHDPPQRPERDSGLLRTQLESHPHVIGLKGREPERRGSEEILPSGSDDVESIESAFINLNLEISKGESLSG